MSDGTLSVRRREMKENGNSQLQLDSLSLLSGIHISQANTNSRSKIHQLGELRLHIQTSKRLKEHDKMLKNFRYSAALDSVLKKVGGRCLFYCRPLHPGLERPTNNRLRIDTRIDTPRWTTDSAFRTG
jgi:hypothetical protein